MSFRYSILIFSIFMAGCSAITKPAFYRPQFVSDPEGFSVGSDYRGYRLYQKRGSDDSSQSVSITVLAYGEKLYSVGPIFLPIIPVFYVSSWSTKLDNSKNLAIYYCAYSSPAEGSVKELPIPTISVASKARVKPISKSDIEPGSGCQTFTFDYKLKDISQFEMSPTKVKLDNNKTIDVPGVKFVFTEKVSIDWAPPLAP